MYSARRNFRQFLYVIWYLDHPLTFTEHFTEIVPGEPREYRDEYRYEDRDEDREDRDGPNRAKIALRRI